MYIIKREASSNGGRPPLQPWTHKSLPEGFAFCPDEFHDIFYSTSPAGFVELTIEDDIVTGMAAVSEKVDAYKEANPEVEEEDTSTPQDDTDAMLIDHEYRLTLLELGISE